MLTIIAIVVPLVFPSLIQFERLAALVLHSFNKLSPTFIDNEIKCCG
jgi:hypothetical protein